MTEGLRIVSLEVDNVKRLHAVHIKPDGNMVVIGGKNGAGKSSVLDAIEMALGGKKSIPRRPVRDGEESARVVCDLDTLIVRRTFTPDGKTSVVVEAKDGARYATPQAILDDLVGRLSFDPLEFSRLDPPKQEEILRELVGLDFTERDQRRKGFYDARTEHNRDVKRLQGQLEGYPQREAPDEEVSVSELAEELERAQTKERVAEVEAREARRAVEICEATKQEMDDLKVEVDQLIARAKQVAERFDMENANSVVLLGNAGAARKAVPDLGPIRERLRGAEGVNAKVRENKTRAELQERLKAARKESDERTAKIEAIDKEKHKTVEAAKFPVDGLALDDDGVSFEGVPFEQASSAEHLRVSVAIGIAMNPKLRVLLIRDGSLLDEESMVLLAQLAKDANAQVWLERVGTGDASAVIIEDGSVLRKGD